MIRHGDRVKVFDVNGRRNGMPKGGWDGEVTSVGRKLVSIIYERSYGRPQVFRIDSGQSNDAYGHQFFRTLEQAVIEERKNVAIKVIQEYGLELRFELRRNIPVHQLEALAEVVKCFETERKDDAA